jgi:hypothetical protein
MTVSIHVAAEDCRPALLMRPWQLADMPGVLAAMAHEYPAQGLWSHPEIDIGVGGPSRWTGPRDANEAAIWLSGQDRGWQRGDWLTLAVLDQQRRVLAHVGLKNGSHRASDVVGDTGIEPVTSSV